MGDRVVAGARAVDMETDDTEPVTGPVTGQIDQINNLGTRLRQIFNKNTTTPDDELYVTFVTNCKQVRADTLSKWQKTAVTPKKKSSSAKVSKKHKDELAKTKQELNNIKAILRAWMMTKGGMNPTAIPLNVGSI